MASRQTYIATSCRPSELAAQHWWPQLHSMINDAFHNKNYSVFPPSWTRLDEDPLRGAEGLENELGNWGLFIVLLGSEGSPAACTGALPFRGEKWINEVEEKGDAEIANGEVARSAGASSGHDLKPDWETCCFCVSPAHRGAGLAHRLLDELIALTKAKGAKRLISNYAVDETAGFWARLGFEVVPGAGGMLRKGFQTDPEKEGLRADIYFEMAAKKLS
jgi:GNAT superfamily N-acetyltransferase